MVGKCVVMAAFAASVLAQLPVATIPKADKKGSKDSPLLKRYEGSFIVSLRHKSFGELTLPLSKLEECPERRPGRTTGFTSQRTRRRLKEPIRESPT